ncbi:MAG: amino acid adenylation domain-containing protein [Luteolibacter sp.]|uniref:amino acid adenylation domain-containing protein n=1 Tax=Luteolibacter sp. TaxID=1962973 RepID=UPI0032676C12
MPFPVSNQPEIKTTGLLHELLDERAAAFPQTLGFRFLEDGDLAERLLTYGGLASRARSIASGLVRHGATGQPVLLIQPPGLEFIESLFACWYAGAIAVPAYPPRGGRHRRRLNSILSDCGALIALAPASQLPIPGVVILQSEALVATETPLEKPLILPDSPGLLQYTSGSTSEPKGVMISHQNIRSHFASLRCFADLDLRSAVSWLPPYHDMGLILKILSAFEAGIPLTFFSPDHFVQRPVRWLRTISRYRGEFSGAPNFAFEMCIRSIRDEELEGLDLSCWKAAPCGAERVRPETLERFAKRFSKVGFRAEAFLPGYGLAESTLTVTASSQSYRISEHHHAGRLVSSGKPLTGVGLRIADPIDGQTLGEREIGEIRVEGGIVSAGYWNRPDATHGTFFDKELRTGDLGYIEDGELYVTGRIKDLIIIDGTNHSPEDIESAAFSAVPEITAAAAFSTEGEGRESIVIALEAKGLTEDRYSAICRKIRHSVGELLEVPIGRVILVRSGLLPRTTSGKIRRATCKEAVLQGSLKLLFDDGSTIAVSKSSAISQSILMEIVAEVTGRDGAGPDDDVVGFGMTSMETTRLAALLEARTGVSISIGELFSARSFHQIAALLSPGSGAGIGFPEVLAGSGTNADILTHSQERMWFLHQLNPESAAYHIFGSLELTGPLDAGALERAIVAVVSRHDILCSRHGSEDGRPRVWIEKNVPPPVEHRIAENETGVHEFITCFARKPFDLAKDTPMRACIVSRGENRHILAVCVHHIAADGWSIKILAREIANAYAALRSGNVIPPTSSRTNYLDYAVSHRKWIDSGAVDAQIDYWKSKLAGHSGVLQLATDFARPPETSSDGGSIEQIISADLCNRVSALAKLHRGTPFMVHLAAFLLLLRRHGAGDDPVVAIPVANRNHAAAGDLIGTLVNTLPFRLPLEPDLTFSMFIEQVRTATFEMQAAQEAPFEKIIDAVKPDRSRDHSPLAQVMFDYQEIPISETWTGNLECRPFNAHRGAVQFDLSLLLTVLSDRQQLAIEYRTDLFLPETAGLMMSRYLEILETGCREPSRKLSEITGLCESDRSTLEKSTQGAFRPDFITTVTPDLISKRATLHPHRLAVTSNDDLLDYAALESKSDALASALHTQGIRPGDRLAILLERDVHLPVALLAAWKVGAAYVPLDRANPPERLKLILDDQQPIRVLASPGLVTCLPADASIILMDDHIPAKNPAFHPYQNLPADTAYIIYTSGSTGKPKGVVISHGALANFLQSMAEEPGFAETDRLLAVTTISFDISALEIFLPLICGGCVDLISTSTARDGAALLDHLIATKPTVMQATPATWRLLIDSGWQGSPGLTILCGGETLDLPLASQLRPMGDRLWNLYGPTETTVWSAVWEVPEEPEFIRIGHPIANTGIDILAPDGTPLAPGVTGELWISGSGLADGYWNRIDLNDANFAMVPERRYHTGDLGRRHRDGTLECLGRSDGQVKIRGFRVELGEIENVLADHPKVSQARVAFRGADPYSRKLVAWVIPKKNSDPPPASELRTYLSGLLPFYMLPTDIGVIDVFPLGSSGKVDLSKLTNPAPQPQSTRPLTQSERKLATIWSELLGRPEIQQTDDWFHIGGHSLLALRLFSRIRGDFKRTLPLSTILDHSTLEALASIIDKTPPDEENPVS